ncbi:E3 ubiquitin ligase SCF complex Skp subunit, partial [Punctularia strigosozonata HHB-11173 SS5]
MVVLITSDDERIVVEDDIAKRSGLIRDLLAAPWDPKDGDREYMGIELPIVSSDVLKKILEYCEHHKEEPFDDTYESEDMFADIDEWDLNFITADPHMAFEIVLAANYLEIPPLVSLGSKAVANMMRGKDAEEICDMFNIEKDFEP